MWRSRWPISTPPSPGTRPCSGRRWPIGSGSNDDGVEEALLKVADSYIQLLTPVTPESPVARYLERHGEGLHHIGYRVADVTAALETLKAQGARVIDAVPRPGSRGTTVAFVHPKASFGTLIELVQE